MEKVTYYCDICREEILNAPYRFEKRPSFQIIVLEGNFKKRHLESINPDLCKVCISRIMDGEAIYSKPIPVGVASVNGYDITFKKPVQEDDEYCSDCGNLLKDGESIECKDCEQKSYERATTLE